MLALLWTRSDEYVVRRVLSGRRNDFGVLVRRYLPAVLSVARGILKNPADADDVSQECFLAAYQKLDTLKAPEKFAGWLMAIARHAALNWQRSRSREVPLEEAMAEALHRDEPAPDRKEMQQMLHATLMDLDPEVRELLLMHYYGGCSLREIGRIKGINRLAAGKRLQRAREALGAEFLKLVPDAPTASAWKKRARTITAAVLAAGAAWKTVPAYGMIATLAMGALKLAGVGAGIAALSAGALFAAPTVMGWKPDLPVPRTMTAKAGVTEKTVAPVPAEAAAAAALNETAGEGEGEKDEPLFTYSSVLATPLDQTIGNAEVVAERITWAARELPPPETERWVTMADANGTFTFAGLPPGKYCITAKTRIFGGATDITLRDAGSRHFPNIKMYPFISSYGLLQDAGGKPVAGAAIYPVSHELFPREEFSHARIAGLRASTDDQGRFQFPGIIPGRWKLYVVAPGHEPYYSDYFPCFGLQSRLVIQDPGTLAGRIVDSAGRPRAKVKGMAHLGEPSGYSDEEGYSYRMQYKFTSNEEGTFQIDAMPPASYAFSLNDAALVLSSPNTTAVVTSGGTAQVELAVQTGGTLYGRVLNAKTREGVADADMSLYSMRGEVSVSRHLKTGAAGDYIFTGLPASTYEIRCEAGRSFDRSNREPMTVNLKLGETLEDKDILLEPALMLAGRVVDVNGKPAAAEVFMRGGQYDQTKSAEDGSFALALKDSSRVVVTAVTKTMRSEATPIDPAEFSAKELTLRLTVLSGSRIEGVVLDGRKKPLYNAMINVSAGDAGEPVQLAGGGSSRTDSAGKFVLEGLSAGDYIVSASLQYQPIAATPVSVPVNAVVRDVVLQEAPAGRLTIEGVVSYPNGLPCPFAVLGLGTRQATTAGALGRFAFKDLAEGRYDVYVMSPGYSPTVVRGVDAGNRSVKIALSDYVTLVGTVVDAKLKAPVKDFTVAYHAMMQMPFDTNGIESGERGFSDPLGGFRIEKVLAFPTHVEVRAAGYAAWSADIADPAGGQETALAVELQTGAPVTGMVRNEAGEPVASAQVSAPGVMPVTSDAAGTFAIEGLAAGQETQITVSCNGYATERVAVTPGSGAPLDIVLKQTGRLLVHASLDGKPLSSFVAACRVPGGEDRMGSVGTRDGEAVFQNAPPGETEVTVHASETETNAGGTATVTVVAGQDTAVDVAVSPGTASLEGQVLADGTAPPHAFIGLMETSSGMMGPRIDLETDGTFRMTGLQPGEYHLGVSTYRSGMSRLRIFAVSDAASQDRAEIQTISLTENGTRRILVEYSEKADETRSGGVNSPAM